MTDTDSPSGRPFDRAAALAALSQAALEARECKQVGDPSGEAIVKVVFAPSGAVSSVSIDPPFAGTPTGGCIESAFTGARVPPFDGDAVEVEQRLTIE